MLESFFICSKYDFLSSGHDTSCLTVLLQVQKIPEPKINLAEWFTVTLS